MEETQVELWNDMKVKEQTQVEQWEDLENTEENCEMIGTIWKKPKLNSEKFWKIQKKIVMLGISLSELFKWVSKKLRKVSWIVKRFGKYRRKVSWIVKRYEKYERNPSWIMKWYEK
jgi:hypothetical protein